ncbi:Glycoside Hydrolase Family 16 protein [Gigaspora rosea]|uniref:Glycoside Hydrolase Family 16 protein n=1 Tax=Gigaspora rosea TaxID=44941 RepID=A0A397ULV1_9GLOM|nr:Glycoside Hydrolase Family 16 protein [Gigaspora rosea]
MKFNLFFDCSWGSSHNGAALMLGNSSYHENIYLNNSVLTLKATRNNSQINGRIFDYLSGTNYGKELIEVNSQYPNYLICVSWLTYTTWPPKVDMLEFKGSTLNNFNIYINQTVPTYSDQINITSPND